MTDRGLPLVDGAPACPFVAFEDDREERASASDTRHRCYAEVRPAPRAQAHQDAYCLSSAFALCPTFQDWARREGARIRDEPPAESLVSDVPQRNPYRGWSAPPPWLGSSDQAAGTARSPGRERDPARDEDLGPGGRPEAPLDFTSGRRRPDAGLAGSLAHQIALDGGAAATPPPVRPDDPDEEEADDDIVELEQARDRRLDEFARPEPWPVAAHGYGEVASGRMEPGARDPGAVPDTDARAFQGSGSGVAGPRQQLDRSPTVERVGGLLPARGRPKVGDTRPPRRAGSAPPPWERAHHRYDAYPTIRTRIGLPAIPRVAILFIALLLAALGLFFLPTLLGFNAPKATPTPLQTTRPSALSSGSLAPSVLPGPTATTYVVQPGDTMSAIAGRFGVPLADLIAANKDKYPNPDKIAVGDTIIIPAPVPSGFNDAGTPVPSRAPSPTIKR